jgi:hypothetical protein
MTRYLSISAIDFKAPAVARLAVLCVACAGWGHATGNPSLQQILDKVGRQVQSFWTYIPGVTCTETLTQAKLGEKGKVLFQQRTAYAYLVLLESQGGDVSVDESRMEKTKKATKAKASLLQTSGFSILALIFHPLYQSRYEFTRLPDDPSDQGKIKIGFRQVTAEGTPSVLLLRDRQYPLEWSGTAWVDPVSYAVTRIKAELKSPMEGVGLLSLGADVSYAPVAFGGSVTYWLPARAVIEASTRRQHWRNVDLFSDYQRFDVETETRAVAPQ